jgi:hypothetical protein
MWGRHDLHVPIRSRFREGVNTSSAVYAFVCPHVVDNPIRFALSSLGAFMRRLVRPWTVSPRHIIMVNSRIHLEPVHAGCLPVASSCCEHMSLHLPGLRSALPTQHPQPRWHLPRHKLGGRQDLGHLEGGVSTSIPLASAYVEGSSL